MRKLLVAVVSALALGACSWFPGGEPPPVPDLTVAATFSSVACGSTCSESFDVSVTNNTATPTGALTVTFDPSDPNPLTSSCTPGVAASGSSAATCTDRFSMFATSTGGAQILVTVTAANGQSGSTTYVTRGFS